MPDSNQNPESTVREFKGDKESREANRLYWDTEESVNGIAERMELSKGRLYDMITSLPVSAECPECGDRLVFSNRTARDHGELTCESCGFESHRDDVSGDSTPQRHPATRGKYRALQPDRMMIGSVLMGLAVGLAVGRWIR